MTVRFFASLRELVSRRMEVLEFPGGDAFTVEDALIRLRPFMGQSFLSSYLMEKRAE